MLNEKDFVEKLIEIIRDNTTYIECNEDDGGEEYLCRDSFMWSLGELLESQIRGFDKKEFREKCT